MLRLIAFVKWSSVQVQPGSAAAEVYAISIGSSAYSTPVGSESRGFQSLLGMNNSARLFATRLVKGGARRAMVLTSGAAQFVTVMDVQSVVSRMIEAIRRDRPTAPLVVFYFAGHGISEGVGWNHFSIPGDFTYRPPLARLNIEALVKRTLHAASLVDELGKTGIPYLVLLDTCYEGIEAKFESPILTGPAIESLRNIAAVVRAFNEFRQPNPVLFSTKPGTTVKPVPDPSDSGPDPVGPLGRRALLTFDNADRNAQELTLKSFVSQMTANDLDDVTRPAITFAEPGPAWARVIYRSGAPVGQLDEQRGSAIGPAGPCCQ